MPSIISKLKNISLCPVCTHDTAVLVHIPFWLSITVPKQSWLGLRRQPESELIWLLSSCNPRQTQSDTTFRCMFNVNINRESVQIGRFALLKPAVCSFIWYFQYIVATGYELIRKLINIIQRKAPAAFCTMSLGLDQSYQHYQHYHVFPAGNLRCTFTELFSLSFCIFSWLNVFLRSWPFVN